jgi:hypothetical protein
MTDHSSSFRRRSEAFDELEGLRVAVAVDAAILEVHRLDDKLPSQCPRASPIELHALADVRLVADRDDSVVVISMRIPTKPDPGDLVNRRRSPGASVRMAVMRRSYRLRLS